MIKGYLTTNEVAERLGVTVGRVRQFVAEKRLPATKIGRDNLIAEKHLSKIQIYGKVGRPKKEVK